MFIKTRFVIVLILLSFSSTFPTTSHAFEGQLNLNTATAKELQTLPFIGKKKAKEIIRYRQKNGPFANVDQLQDSPAVGPSTMEAIRPYLKVSGSTAQKARSKKPYPDSTFTVRPKISTTPGQIIMLADKEYYNSLLNFIHYAEKSIDISMFLFKTTKSKKNKPSLLVKALIDARKRGVRVNVLLEKSGYSEDINEENKRTARKLKRQGIDVRFDTEKTITHTKIVIIDQRFCFVGSHNFSHSALNYNHEFSLLVDSKVMAKELREYIADIH